MRTLVLLLIVLLTLGLCSVPAPAGDQAVIQPLPASCQPVSDVELAQLNGKAMMRTDLLGLAVRYVESKIPPRAQQEISRVVEAVRILTGGPTKVPAR
jgi:hypothetical protein